MGEPASNSVRRRVDDPSGVRVGVVFGGRSAEHDVSCASALSVLRALESTGFEYVAIGITRNGHFVLPARSTVREAVCRVVGDNAAAIDDGIAAVGEEVRLVSRKDTDCVAIVSAGSSSDELAELDVVFPVLHGPYGEDGTIQGLLEVLGVPYLGSGVLGSAVAMDKAAAKRAFAAENIPQVEYSALCEAQWHSNRCPDEIIGDLGLPLFVKPANLGSSVGISRVDREEDLPDAIDAALRYDHHVVIEQGIDAREIECGVLGGLAPKASPPGEIIAEGSFYDFESKYVNDGAQTVVPAELSEDVSRRIQELAIEAFKAVGAWGLSRVDFFYDERNEEIYVNEINTMPGFTSISMFAKMWIAAGMAYEEQIVELIELAFERHELMRRRASS